MFPIPIDPKTLVSPARMVDKRFPKIRHYLSSTQAVAIVCFVVGASRTSREAADVLHALESLLMTLSDGHSLTQNYALAESVKYLASLGYFTPLPYFDDDEVEPWAMAE